MRFGGHFSLLDTMAARTRSRASRHEASGKPTMVNPGNPSAAWTSTDTGWPHTPTRVAERTVASIAASVARGAEAAVNSAGG